MAATYSGEPGSVWVDYVRFRLGDTDIGAVAILQDGEITSLASLPRRQQLARCAEYMASVFARRAQATTNDQTKIQFIDRAEYYTALAKAVMLEPLPPAFEDGGGYSTVGFGLMDAPDLGDLDNGVLDREDPTRERWS